MTDFFLIRHTQAEGNLFRMMQGHWDGRVTRLGRKQIEALAERFSSIPVDAVYSSDLYRTRLTATAVTRHKNLPLRLESRFREIDMGPWEACFFGNLSYSQPEAMDNFLNHPDRWQIEGSENYALVQKRAMAALQEVLAAHEGKTLAIVSHGVTIRCLVAALTDTPLEQVDSIPIFGNTSVTHFTYENGRFTMDLCNDMSHLEALGIPQWHNNSVLRHLPVDPMENRAYYISCYEQAWTAAHGSLHGFQPAAYLDSAGRHYRHDRESVLCFYDWETPVGLLDLDTERGQDTGIGWISLIWLREDYRGRNLAVQLLGRAVHKYRTLGRSRLQLTVAEGNAAARRFYERSGFVQVGSDVNALGKLLLLEKDLGADNDV